MKKIFLIACLICLCICLIFKEGWAQRRDYIQGIVDQALDEAEEQEVVPTQPPVINAEVLEKIIEKEMMVPKPVINPTSAKEKEEVPSEQVQRHLHYIEEGDKHHQDGEPQHVSLHRSHTH